jgi:hypothetical protein
VWLQWCCDPRPNDRLHNNGLQLTRSARCAPSPSDGGQSLRAALAAEPGCSTNVSRAWCQGADVELG